MDSTLEADILKKVPYDISEMYSTCLLLVCCKPLSACLAKMGEATIPSYGYDLQKRLFQNFRTEGKRSLVWGNGMEPLYPNSLRDIY